MTRLEVVLGEAGFGYSLYSAYSHTDERTGSELLDVYFFGLLSFLREANWEREVCSENCW